MVAEARSKVKDVAKVPNQYRKLLTDLLVQVRGELGMLAGPCGRSEHALLSIAVIVQQREDHGHSGGAGRRPCTAG